MLKYASPKSFGASIVGRDVYFRLWAPNQASAVGLISSCQPSSVVCIGTGSCPSRTSDTMEVGADNKKLKVGDRVVVPFTICCGECEQCRKGNWSVCESSNRTADVAADVDRTNKLRGRLEWIYLAIAGGQPCRWHGPLRRSSSRPGQK